MRDLPRKDRVAMTALANAIEHEPALRPVLVEDYARARLDFKEARALRDFLARRLAAVLFARRGVLTATQRLDSTWWQWPRRAHSEKPEAFLDMVEATSPGPYLEMFARRARIGWEYWGNESLGTAEVAA